MTSMHTNMNDKLRKYLVSFGALVNHAVPTECLGGGEGLGTHKALVGTLPSVTPHMACHGRILVRCLNNVMQRNIYSFMNLDVK